MKTINPSRLGEIVGDAIVRSLMREDGLDERAAVEEAQRTLALPEEHPEGWRLSSYGEQAEAVREAAAEHLRQRREEVMRYRP